MKLRHIALLGTAMLAPVAAHAGARTQTGTINGKAFTATSRIIGQNSTATVVSGGNPLYLANNAAGYSGVVGMLMTYSNGDQFVCSGSLLAGGRAILTAGHCVSNGGGVKAADLVRTQVIFQNAASSTADANVYALGAGTTAIDVDSYKVNSGYTGDVIDQNDIAILRLSQLAPAYAQQYDIADGNDLTGVDFNVSGYGRRSLTGGVDGYTGPGAGAGTGRRRQGDNTYDFRLGDAAFGDYFKKPDPDTPGSTNIFGGTADLDFSYISDFDNGLSANDASCFVAADAGITGGRFCGTGLGAREVNIAGGDSGGGAFVNGKLASVNSYGLTFGTEYGDIKCTPGPGNCLNGSFGEFSGYVPTYIHRDWINSTLAAVPEPATWVQMMLGFGLVGGAIRTVRRRTAVTA